MPTPTVEGARSPCGRGAICHHVRVNSREAVVDGGGGNGFMFRARSQEDAEIFADEFRRRGRRGRPSRLGAVIVAVIVASLVILGLIDRLG